MASKQLSRHPCRTPAVLTLKGSVISPSCKTLPLLFLLALDWVSRQALGDNETGIQLTLLQKLEDLVFADDIVLLSQKIAHICDRNFEALQEQAARVGLKVNAAKTKDMRIRSPAYSTRVPSVVQQRGWSG